ncbi:hypothetical protein FVE85_1156 [Porphyridium purpureum]|uniref:Glutaredoxin n=1 Tax=Porphyridium purpureum TaxID=35688 RepID=A0A5J4Z4C1_PORPP|nr:hypothetical protein FVE85_1156 [Porphyridium purpureum]|eukprot:POR2729..scf208_2
MSNLIIYSSSAGGSQITHHTLWLEQRVNALAGECSIVYVDTDPSVDKKKIWAISGKKGVYPLLFKGDTFIGDFEQCKELNECELLQNKLKD